MDKSNKSRYNEIESVKIGSIGEEAGIEKGDLLTGINGVEIIDILDYIYLTNDEYLVLEVIKTDGEMWEIEVEKSYDEDLGLVFVSPTIDRIIRCRNKCMFCFVDQMPKGMRSSLYVKDDDYRLSALHGNFVTLTNMKDEDLERIMRYHISPINVSVHATDPELRMRMMGNKDAGNVIEQIRRLSECNITINAQIVLCPGLNDGSVLEKTLVDLADFYPSVQNVAIVPVGLTKFRHGLAALDKVGIEKARETIEIVERMQTEFKKRLGKAFAYLSDEFYIIAKMEFPSYDDYDGFPQIENGVGLVRKFERQIIEAAGKSQTNSDANLGIAIATGKLAYGFMSRMAKILEEKIPELSIKVVMVRNDFFGNDITVSGLLSGEDLKAAISEIEERIILVPGVMVKEGTTKTVDDLDIGEIGIESDKEIIPVEVDGLKLVGKIIELKNRS